MSWSVTETFERIRPRLPPSLDGAALERCARIAGRLPNELTSHYLEVHFGSAPRIDFLTYSREKSIAKSLAAALGSEPSRVWGDHLAILHDWASEGGELSSAPFIWFEFDGHAGAGVTTEPSLVVGVEQDYFGRRRGGHRGSDAAELALGRTAFRRLLPAQLRDVYLAALERCYAALPPLGAIPYAPVMAVRSPVTAKPFVILPRTSVFEFLRTIEWPGSTAALSEVLETYYSAFREQVYLDITVTDRVGERLGIATSQFQNREADLTTVDWWRPPKELKYFKNELRDWVGLSEEYLGGERVWLRRWFDTKVVLTGTKVEYKAYLGFSAVRPPPFC